LRLSFRDSYAKAVTWSQRRGKFDPVQLGDFYAATQLFYGQTYLLQDENAWNYRISGKMAVKRWVIWRNAVLFLYLYADKSSNHIDVV